MTFRTLFAALAAVLSLAVLADRAEALCVAPSIESGRYVNVDPAARSITNVDLEFVCGNRTIHNDDGTATLIHDGDPHWTLSLWGSCHPTDCAWGATRGEGDSVGRVLAGYDQGFARRSVVVSEERPGLIRVGVTSWYTDGRPTRTTWDFLRLR
ncbi:hypothetical protein HKCCE2091_06000 [Rhodobacterales bacterium HKCCE2091]|nr:hypothetical protein [Rhodobacterales bacterium HKCCE2091]